MMLKISNLRYEILRDVIISDFSLRLRAGEVKTLFGPSGCGKTSLLRLVCGDDITAGDSAGNGVRGENHSVPRCLVGITLA